VESPPMEADTAALQNLNLLVSAAIRRPEFHWAAL